MEIYHVCERCVGSAGWYVEHKHRWIFGFRRMMERCITLWVTLCIEMVLFYRFITQCLMAALVLVRPRSSAVKRSAEWRRMVFFFQYDFLNMYHCTSFEYYVFYFIFNPVNFPGLNWSWIKHAVKNNQRDLFDGAVRFEYRECMVLDCLYGIQNL